MKIKVQYEGKEIEVEAPENLVDRAEIANEYVPKAFVEHEVKRRASSMAKKQLDAMFADDKQKGELAKRLGLDATKTGDGKDLTEQLKSAQANWEREHLQPLRDQLTAKTTREQRLLQNKLERDIVAAGAAIGVRKEFLTPVAKGQPAPFVTMVSEIFGFSEEHDDFFVKNGDSYQYSSNPAEAGVPYKSVAEFLTKDFVKTPNAKLFLTDERQRGPGIQTPGGQHAAGNIVLSRQDALNPQKYQAAKADAQKRGVDIEIAD